jgi:hypothetical protein
MRKIIFICLSSMFIPAAYAQLKNLDFEVWDSTIISPKPWPQDWPLLQGDYCTKSVDAQQGVYALMVSAWYFYTKATAIQIQSTHTNPVALTGYYTYTNNFLTRLLERDTIMDTALVSIYLTQWNSTTLHRDTIGTGQLPLSASAAYSYFQCPIHYTTSTIPDTVILVLDPSLIRRHVNATTQQVVNATGLGSFFTVDNLTMETITGNKEWGIGNTLTVYPNPFTDQLTLLLSDYGIYTVTIYDISGKYITTEEISMEHNTINMKMLPKGTYILQVAASNDHLMHVIRCVKQ